MSLSESARVNTAAEHSFRIAAPNSRPRFAGLVALDDASVTVVADAVADAPERRRAIGLLRDGEGWLRDLPEKTQALIEDISRSDMVVMVAAAGYDGTGASLIGEACRLRGVMVTSVVIAETNADLTITLARLRPFAGMIVVASSADYVRDMLTALRA